MKEPKQFTEQLPVPLTDADLAKLADQQDFYIERLEELEAEKRNLPKRIESAKDELFRLNEKRRTRTKTVAIQCEERPDFEMGTIETVRLDTLEVIRTRAVTEADRQENLFENPTGDDTLIEAEAQAIAEMDAVHLASLTETEDDAIRRATKAVGQFAKAESRSYLFNTEIIDLLDITWGLGSGTGGPNKISFYGKGGKKPRLELELPTGKKILKDAELYAEIRRVHSLTQDDEVVQPMRELDYESVIEAMSAEADIPADDFTAEKCPECERIDGAHTPSCTLRPDAISFEDYQAYVIAHRKGGVKNHASQARKLQLSGAMDDGIRAWLAEAEPDEVKPAKQLKDQAIDSKRARRGEHQEVAQ